MTPVSASSAARRTATDFTKPAANRCSLPCLCGLFIVLCVLLMMPRAGRAQDELLDRLPRASLISADQGPVFLQRGWLYHRGYDVDGADPALDDTDWQPVGWQIGHEIERDDWGPQGWLRYHLRCTPDAIGKPMMLFVFMLGAAEFYIDGELLQTAGVLGDSPEAEVSVHHDRSPLYIPIVFTRTEHVIAVKLSNFVFFSDFDYGKDHWEGVGFGVGPPHEVARIVEEHNTRITGTFVFFGASALMIAVVHMLLFAFYPAQKSNLYYSLFTALAAGIALIPWKLGFAESEFEARWLIRAIGFVLVAICPMGLRFLYEIFYERLPRYFWIWPVAAAIVFVMSWNGPLTNVMIFTLVAFVELFRILGIAVVRGKPNAWIITIAVAGFIVPSSIAIASNLFEGVEEANPFLYLYGLLLMLILMSFALARGFANINRNLKVQLVQIKELSTQAMDNERRAREREVERMRLETENAMQAQELEEARKRQQVLDELERANAELHRTQAQLVHSEKMAALGDLVAGVAHEINTPVGAIHSMHDTMVRAVGKLKARVRELDPEGYNDDPVQKAFKLLDDANEVIDSGSTRVTGIVKRLRSFARLDEAELKRVNIHDGIDDTLTLVHHELKHGISVVKNYGKIPPIACYPGQLNQVFLNLLVNARHAMAGTGTISITTAMEGDRARIDVADTGKGIPPEMIGRVFDPGFTTKGVGVGTGLGLSICYQIIEAHQGTITVDSVVDSGTTFTILLPMNMDQTTSS